MSLNVLKNTFGKPAVADITFFLLEQKEPKIQERLIARPRTRSAQRAWVATFLVITLQQYSNFFKLKTSIYAFWVACKIYAQARKGRTKRPEGSGLS